MTEETLFNFKNAISKKRNALVEWLNMPLNKKNINLGNAGLDDVADNLSIHDKSLERIDRGDFGLCEVCNETVEEEALIQDFTACVCLTHYSEEQLRLLERDLELASKIQRKLLPQELPNIEHLEISAFSEPAQIVSGDYYDFFDYQDGSLGIVIADVMGKGLASSMLLSNVQASIRILGSEYKNLDELAERLNQLFRFNIKLSGFITLILVKINIAENTLQYCNAGHNPGIIFHKENNDYSLLKPTGPAIGLTKDSKYLTEIMSFQPGDILLLYTDGIIESRNSINMEFGIDNVINFIKINKGYSSDRLIAGLRRTALNFSGKFNDDVTLVNIKYK